MLAKKQLASILIVVVAATFSGGATFSDAANLTREAETLLAFKQGLTQAEERLSHWTAEEKATVCETWQGVICSKLNATVIGLNFTDFNIGGTLTMPLCELPNLAEIRFRSNSFSQSFPDFMIQFCKELTVIDFSLNEFYGQLPVDISSNLSKLQVFNMESNYFNGSIPPDLGNLSQLRLLRLRGNCLARRFPPELGRLSLLQTLDLSWNCYDAQAEIPQLWSNLSSLQELDLPGCNLMGEIPAFIGNFSHLWFLSLAINNLSGAIPSSLANLQNLSELYLYSNHLSGPIPPFSSSSSPHISTLQLHNNSLSGTIPTGLASLSALNTLRLDQNLLSGPLPNALPSLPNLTTLVIFGNNLTGTLSSDWGLHSTLIEFDVTDNHFTGAFPPHLCKANRLLYLALHNNLLTGEIPAEYNDCKSVLRFTVNKNQLSGSVPRGLWTLPSLQVLNLKNNNLSGKIFLGKSDVSSKSGSLQTVFLDSNQFEGPLPSQIGQFWFNLTKLTAPRNKLSGSVPSEIGLLSNLESLDLSTNAISGEIPTSIGNCSSLTSLILSHNDLSGAIPAQLSQIQNLNHLDLSNNHLNGSIPTSLANSTYEYFNVSYNDLSGMVPEQLASAFNSSYFEGNQELCLPQSCDVKGSKSGRTSIRLLVLIVVLGASTVLLCVALMVRICRKRSKGKMEVANDWKVVSYQKLEFNEEELYKSLDEKNVIGWGGSGRVYKVVLKSEGQVVAVKKITNCRVINTPNLISPGLHVNKKDENSPFKAEMEILGKIKHRNIVELMCSCTCISAKLLVYEYMCNGSLGDVLHRAFRNELLSWATRFHIALGAAEGLAYLHHDCVPPILHRDIKSNNILLDSSFQAKLADFGVAKSFQGKGPMTGVVGSVGYIAPEYAYTLKVDEKSDVYSYGVVLLELLTGRSPTSKELESEGFELVKWVGQLILTKEGIWNVFDCRLDVGDNDKGSMQSVLKIALLCTCVLPRKRPSMLEVVELLRQSTPISTLPSHHQAHHDIK